MPALEQREDRRIAAWLGVCAALAYLPFVHGHFSSSDEVGVFATTEALYRTGSLATDGAGLAHDFEGRGGRRYSIFGVGQPVLALPFYALGDVLDRAVPRATLARAIGRRPTTVLITRERPEILAVTLYPPCASGVLLALFFLLERRLGCSRRGALMASALLAGSTYVATQSVYFLRHTTETVLILGAFLAFLRYRQGASPRSLAVGCLLASSIVLVRVPAAVVGPALAGYLAFVVVERARREPGVPGWPRVAGAVVLPALAVALVHVAVNWAKWGTFVASPMLAQSSGFTTPMLDGLMGLLISPGASVFVYSPLLLLLPATLPGFFRSHRAECVTVLAVSLSLLLLVARFELWHGLPSAPGSRMVFALVPLAMLPLGPWLDGRPRRVLLALLVALALAGTAVQLGLMTARWSQVVVEMGYRGFRPLFGYLWDPAMSPAWGALRTALHGGTDAWLVTLFTGVPMRPPAPLLGATILSCWAVAFSLALLRLRRVLARAGAGDPPESSAEAAARYRTPCR